MKPDSYLYIRIGFDDERTRDGVYSDLWNANVAQARFLAGVWSAAEIREMLAAAWISNKITEIVRNVTRGIVTLDEAVILISKVADRIG